MDAKRPLTTRQAHAVPLYRNFFRLSSTASLYPAGVMQHSPGSRPQGAPLGRGIQSTRTLYGVHTGHCGSVEPFQGSRDMAVLSQGALPAVATLGYVV